ncbi:MAG: hydrogenase small subunit [Candidatus Omnitrophota bacterium]
MTTKEIPAIWIQGAGCTGCSISLLNAVSPRVRNLILDEIVPGKKVNLLFHATIMAGEGEPVIDILKDAQERHKGQYVLMVEGAVPTAENGVYGSVGKKGGRHETVVDVVRELGRDAAIVIAVGTCASYGGIPAAKPNPTGCKGVSAVLEESGIKTPVVNIPGCAVHPDWIFGVLSALMLDRKIDVDDAGRPKQFFGRLIHENCQRRADFDKGKFAKKAGEEGCLYEAGCKGHYTYADCSLRQWNSGVNWCVRAGSPCLGCVEPGFPDFTSPFYKKLISEDVKDA